MTLTKFYQTKILEAGCDEAGRGCLAGPVFAAAVILNSKKRIKGLDDSKKLTAKQREELKPEIEEKALAFAVAFFSNHEIDKYNILRSSFFAMHRAIEKLAIKPELLLIDGNRFISYPNTKHSCIIKGDQKFQSIAAASILAKTYRDEWMLKLHEQFPQYAWNKNKGYPTSVHREAIKKFGITDYHRKTFKMFETQMKIV